MNSIWLLWTVRQLAGGAAAAAAATASTAAKAVLECQMLFAHCRAGNEIKKRDRMIDTLWMAFFNLITASGGFPMGGGGRGRSRGVDTRTIIECHPWIKSISFIQAEVMMSGLRLSARKVCIQN